MNQPSDIVTSFMITQVTAARRVSFTLIDIVPNYSACKAGISGHWFANKILYELNMFNNGGKCEYSSGGNIIRWYVQRY